MASKFTSELAYYCVEMRAPFSKGTVLLTDSCTIEPLSSRCFWHVTDQPANWTAAQNFCVATGGNLAAVDSGYISYFLDSNSVFYTNK